MARKGVDAATVLEIVAEADVSQPSFYNHFDSKEALVEAIVREFFDAELTLKERVRKESEDRAESVAANCRRAVRALVADPVVAWVIVRAGNMRNLLRPRIEDPLMREIAEGVETGRFRVGDLRAVTAAIRGAALSVIQDVLEGHAGPEPDARFAELVLRMLGLPPAEAEQLAFAPLPEYLDTP
ncbi:MAG: helix-turn-helix transcriptional regulator [Deltaproteobacteria bacterium]|nr:helix-turn-helix transcriptional regulator [Deltaproteobacteria bacterium]MBW2416388.1 helix-turn-helix transcriptional regulator [Deltaproteobacteria bacterium]